MQQQLESSERIAAIVARKCQVAATVDIVLWIVAPMTA
jgi:hypothetical protein